MVKLLKPFTSTFFFGKIHKKQIDAFFNIAKISKKEAINQT